MKARYHSPVHILEWLLFSFSSFTVIGFSVTFLIHFE